MRSQSCEMCGQTFATSYKRQRFCSYKCNRDSWRAKAGRLGRAYISPSTAGALAELIVCVDLIQKGWDVFRAISPAASCDLVCFRNGSIVRIEVRTGLRSETGSISYHKPTRDRGRQDVYAIVLSPREIVYIPELPEHDIPGMERAEVSVEVVPDGR